jgi:hypothetical protein
MRHIKKYEIFEKRTLGTREKYLNALIDENGDLHKRKGFIINVRRKGKLIEIIVDSDWDYSKSDSENRPHEYIAGIDINGYIIGTNFNNNGNLLNSNGDTVLDPNGDNWKRNANIEDYGKNYHKPEYSNLLTDLPISSGWVNVKIDKEVVKKVERFSRRLAVDELGVRGLKIKLNKLRNPLGILGSRNENFASQIQQKISSLLVLKYLEEIKEKFNATSGGFLFESFIAGLLNGKVPDDNSKVDIVGHDGRTTYQVKLVDWMSDSGNIKLFTRNRDEDNIDHLEIWRNRNTNKVQFCDYYIIGLKQNNKIFIHVIKLDDLGDYLIKSGISLAKLREKSAIRIVGPSAVSYELNLGDLEQKIQKIGDDLKESLNDIWTNLSEVEYNVETITTGQDKKGQTIDWNICDSIFKDSEIRLETVKTSLVKLQGVMKSR